MRPYQVRYTYDPDQIIGKGAIHSRHEHIDDATQAFLRLTAPYKVIAVEEGGQLEDRDGTHLRRVSRPPRRYGFGVDDSPDWRPDGRRIEFLYCYEERCGGGLYSVRSDGSDRRLLAPSSYSGVYSPSGHRVALYSLGYDGAHQNVKCADIFIVPAPERPWHPQVPSLTHNCEGFFWQTHFTGLAMGPSWQPIPSS
jgi:hypothetical protein